jgi:hypothetical protein
MSHQTVQQAVRFAPNPLGVYLTGGVLKCQNSNSESHFEEPRACVPFRVRADGGDDFSVVENKLDGQGHRKVVVARATASIVFSA